MFAKYAGQMSLGLPNQYRKWSSFLDGGVHPFSPNKHCEQCWKCNEEKIFLSSYRPRISSKNKGDALQIDFIPGK